MTTTITSPTAHRSPYEHRVDMVVGVILEHSAIDADAAAILARDILHALDHIPEFVR